MATGKATGSQDALLRALHGTRVRFVRSSRQRSTGFCGLHWHDRLELVYHLSGRGEEWGRDGQAVACGPETMSVHPPRCAHAQRMHSDGEDLCIQVSAPARLLGLERSLFALPAPDPLLRQVFLGLCRLTEDAPLHASLRDQLVRAALAQIAMARSAPPHEDAVVRAQRYLRAHLGTVSSIGEVADAVGIGPDHLRHRFRRATGGSVVGYLTALRIERARELLEHSTLSIGAIAQQCGYADHRHFGEMFRRTHGHSARAHRQMAARTVPSGPG